MIHSDCSGHTPPREDQDNRRLTFTAQEMQANNARNQRIKPGHTPGMIQC